MVGCIYVDSRIFSKHSGIYSQHIGEKMSTEKSYKFKEIINAANYKLFRICILCIFDASLYIPLSWASSVSNIHYEYNYFYDNAIDSYQFIILPSIVIFLLFNNIKFTRYYALFVEIKFNITTISYVLCYLSGKVMFDFLISIIVYTILFYLVRRKYYGHN